MSDDQRIKAAQKNNVEVFLERGPGLDSRYQTWVVARDRARGRALVGGLGGMGVGQMWCAEDGYQDNPGFEDAPEQDSFMQFGTPEYDEQMRNDIRKIMERSR